MPTYSYNDALPTDTDKARSLLGDTDANDWLFSNEHIAAVLTQQGGLAKGVAYLANELVARFGRQPTRMSDQGTTVDYGERLAAWRAIAGSAVQDTGGYAGASGTLGKTAPVQPAAWCPDANDRAYRGDPYRRGGK